MTPSTKFHVQPIMVGHSTKIFSNQRWHHSPSFMSVGQWYPFDLVWPMVTLNWPYFRQPKMTPFTKCHVCATMVGLWPWVMWPLMTLNWPSRFLASEDLSIYEVSLPYDTRCRIDLELPLPDIAFAQFKGGFTIKYIMHSHISSTNRASFFNQIRLVHKWKSGAAPFWEKNSHKTPF